MAKIIKGWLFDMLEMSHLVNRQQSLLLQWNVLWGHAEQVEKGNELYFDEKTKTTQSTAQIDKLRTVFSSKSIKRKLHDIFLYTLSRSSG